MHFGISSTKYDIITSPYFTASSHLAYNISVLVCSTDGTASATLAEPDRVIHIPSVMFMGNKTGGGGEGGAQIQILSGESMPPPRAGPRLRLIKQRTQVEDEFD